MTTPQTRTFLTLGPGGMAVEVLPGIPGSAPFSYVLDEGPSRDAVSIAKAIDSFSRIDMRPISKAFELVNEAARALGDGLTLTFDAGTYVEGTVYPSGGHGKRGKRRPGQWGWRARMLRARRLEKARQRRITAAMWAIKPPGGWAW